MYLASSSYSFPPSRARLRSGVTAAFEKALDAPRTRNGISLRRPRDTPPCHTATTYFNTRTTTTTRAQQPPSLHASPFPTMSFDPEQYTGVAAKAVSRAYELASANGNIEVTPLHLASVLYSEPNQLGVQLLQKAQLSSSGTTFSVEQVQNSIERALKKLPSQDPPPSHIGFSSKMLKVLQSAQKLQKAQKDSHTAVDHLILALYDDADVSSALSSVGLTKRKLEDVVKQTRGTRKVTNPNAESTVSLDDTSSLNHCCDEIWIFLEHLQTDL